MAVILHGRYAEIVAEVDRQRMTAYELAHLIKLAFHDPSKMPPFEARAKSVEDEAAERQRLVDDAKVRGWFISMSTVRH